MMKDFDGKALSNLRDTLTQILPVQCRDMEVA